MSSSVIINGKTVQIPKDFFDVGVKASFGENVQANLTTEEFTFILDGYAEIIDWIQKGRQGGLGIFEGIPLTIVNNDPRQSGNVAVFNGILDLQAGTDIQPNLRQVKVRLRQNNSLNQLADLIEPLDFGYLESIGAITKSQYVKVDYVVNKNDTGLETVVTFVTIYLLSKQLADTVKELGSTVATIAGIAASGVSGPIGSTIYAAAVAILQVAYAATLLVLIIDFGKNLLETIVQPLRSHRGVLLKTLLETTCEHIGYTFETSISDLDNLVYLPSNNNVDEFKDRQVLKKAGVIEKGIPNVGDIGYTCTELFQLARDIFNGRFAIIGNTVQFHTEGADYWLKQSSWIKKDVKKNQAEASYVFNTDEIKASILVQFETDITDEYTIKNYAGTSYQVLTDAKTVGVPANKTIRGFDPVRIPLALGTRKNELTPFERALLPLANLFDTIADTFGKNPKLTKKIKNKIGVLQVGSNNHSIPKLIYMQGGRIPSNHRSLLSAKVLYEKYHSYKSFVQNNFSRQRKYTYSETIPFNLSDFVALLNNSYFRSENGEQSKVVDLEWNMSKDTAIISYWVQEPYTNNLKETFIEPE